MTRVPLLLAVMLGLTALPYMAGDRSLRTARARHLILLSLTSLLGLSVGAVMLLAAAVGPPSLPATSIPDAVGRCVDAAGRLLSHPLTHWPNIIVATSVLALIIRFAYGVVRIGRGERRLRHIVAEASSVRTTADGDCALTVVDSPDPVAWTSGLFRPLIVVSAGFLKSVAAAEREAVLAHERAHVRGWHPCLLFLGRTVELAFGFIPPVRRAATLLLTGLEVAADDAAVRRVGDPIVVARALALMGSFSMLPRADLGVTGGDLAIRARRLLQADGARKRSASIAGAALVAGALVLLASLVVIFAADAPRISAFTRSRELHSVCHLPHPDARS